MDNRLILVEGCPGSGKSSTAQFLSRHLQRAGHPCRWYYEDEQPHPVASARGIAHARGFREYGRSTLIRWRDFAARARRSKQIAIIESHFLQDIVTPLLRAEVKPARIGKLIHRVAEFCAPLKPVLLYLHQPDHAATMRRILGERGPQIEQLHIQRCTASAHGKRLGLEGFEGLVQEWLEARAIIEHLIAELDLQTLSIDNSAGDWAACYRQIGDFLSLPLGPIPSPSEQDLSAYAGTYTYRQDTAPRRRAGETRFGRLDVRRRVGGLPRSGPQHHQKDIEFAILLEHGELVMRDYGWLWPTNRLIPLKRGVFDIRSWPFQLSFERDSSGAVIGASRVSETTRWQITGQRYPRVVEAPDTR